MTDRFFALAPRSNRVPLYLSVCWCRHVCDAPVAVLTQELSAHSRNLQPYLKWCSQDKRIPTETKQNQQAGNDCVMPSVSTACADNAFRQGLSCREPTLTARFRGYLGKIKVTPVPF
ncbi:hypothetical protein RRG08_050171 [Elysia crispata]|uniref:Uncharacterized protein n=1 Tax=Elysia crispata TaxID=231223 RepID=A0AAE0YE92_9GAST|nr:hypothetical protein RRG08_050171 [Elysia crispata]